MVNLVFQSSQGKYVQVITIRAEVKKKKRPNYFFAFLWPVVLSISAGFLFVDDRVNLIA
jgi:hypothetical protein